LNPQEIFFIGAHPDDIDFGCAISMYDHHLRKDNIRSIVLTRGEKGCAKSANRVTEESKALAVLAPDAEKLFLDFPDTKLFQVLNEITNAMREAIMTTTPDIIYIPTIHDTHQDHIAAHHAVMAALNGTKISKILCYETPSSLPTFSPNYFKIFSLERFKVKLKAIKCHESQHGKAYIRDETIYALAKMRAAQGRYYESFAEAFEIARYLEMAL
jgi:LmbE family N-acetylglucosaminyl deacetylase